MISLGNVYPDPNKDNDKKTVKSVASGLNKKVSVFIISIVAVSIIVLLLVAKSNQTDVVDEASNGTKDTVTLLTPDEVASERLHLPTYPVANSTLDAGKSAVTSSSSATILSDAETGAIQTPDTVTPTNDRSTSIKGNNANVPTSIVNEPGYDDKINNVSISYSNSDRNLSEQKRKGVVQTIELSNESFILVDADKILKINITPETKVFINNKQIAISNIQLGDVLEITGSGYNNVSELTATSLNLVAKFKPI